MYNYFINTIDIHFFYINFTFSVLSPVELLCYDMIRYQSSRSSNKIRRSSSRNSSSLRSSSRSSSVVVLAPFQSWKLCEKHSVFHLNPRQCFTLNLIKLLSITLAGQAEFTRKSGSFAHSRPDSTQSSLTNDCNQKCTHTSWLEKLHTEARQLWRMHSRSLPLSHSLSLSLFLHLSVQSAQSRQTGDFGKLVHVHARSICVVFACSCRGCSCGCRRLLRRRW